MLGIGTITKKVFGTPNDRLIKTVAPIIDQINALEAEYEAFSDDQIKAKTEELAKRAMGGDSLDDLLVEAFANCREAARRALGLRAFDVQLMGGIFLHRGNIAEMKTGEGKTLVATLRRLSERADGQGRACRHGERLSGRPRRRVDGQVYRFLGDSRSASSRTSLTTEKRRAAYACDVTYATNNELGFDYLRDNMKSELKQHGAAAVHTSRSWTRSTAS